MRNPPIINICNISNDYVYVCGEKVRPGETKKVLDAEEIGYYLDKRMIEIVK